jgi:hypothetical protein
MADFSPLLRGFTRTTSCCWKTSELSAAASQFSMTPERWQQIPDVLEKALGLAPMAMPPACGR